MTSPFPIIPSAAIPFFIEDSYSLMVQPGNPWNFNPGVVNTDGVFQAGQTVTAWVVGGEFCMIPQPGLTPSAMFDIDVWLEIYDVSVGATPTGIFLHMTPPYGNAPVYQLISQVVSVDHAPVARRSWGTDSPVVFSAKAPATGGPYLIGPAISFNSGLTSAWRCEYQYYLQGAWQAV